MNDCDYVAHLGNTTGEGAGTYGVTFDVACPEGKSIAVTFWTSTAEKESKPSTPFCTVGILAQAGLTGAHATDTGNGYIDITGTIEGIDATRTGTGHSPLLCPETTSTTGKLDIDLLVAGFDQNGEPTALSISEVEGSEQGELTGGPME